MADDVSDVVWPRGIFEAKGGYHQKAHKKLIMNYRYVHNQLVERRATVALHSWGLFFCAASGPIVTSGCCAIT